VLFFASVLALAAAVPPSEVISALVLMGSWRALWRAAPWSAAECNSGCYDACTAGCFGLS